MSNTAHYKSFEVFFEKATGKPPYPYQKKLSESPAPSIINVPTGAGKTAAAILGMWLWHRLTDDSAPRRLAYCLPRRVLVEQTEDKVREWLKRLGLDKRVEVALLMGGNVDRDLGMHPTRECVIIGTQDMLVSGALNRAYGNSPYGWPVIFGLLNNDCMWIMDEIQLMENALPTSVQLDAFRRSFKVFGSHHTVWMSATVNTEWLKTADATSSGRNACELTDQDYRHAELSKRGNAAKSLHKAEIDMERTYNRSGARYLHSLHRKGTATAIIVNTVKRAQELYDAFRKESIDCRLIHSRFRASEREKLNKWISGIDEGDDQIVIATQVLEAGVDVSFRTLVTELAPWSSLVQRFGRCNRKGTLKETDVHWIDIPDEKNYPPYDPDDIASARQKLLGLTGKSVSPRNLPEHREPKIFDAVLRRRDLVDLFDTTPDLTGNYIDASRFVRTIRRRLDVDVFWRGDDKQSKPDRKEMCSVSIYDLKDLLKKNKTRGRVWNHADGEWEGIAAGDIFPSQIIMLDSKDGGYSNTQGWNKEFGDEVEITGTPSGDNDSHDADLQSMSSDPVTLEDHTKHVLDEAHMILANIKFVDNGIKNVVTTAAMYHDIGKTHNVFQTTMRKGMNAPVDEGAMWAKSQKSGIRHGIPGFRHEVASALAYLVHAEEQNAGMKDLTAYLIASHHGKVRLSLRNVSRKNRDSLYLLGMNTKGDSLPRFSSSVISLSETDIDMSIAQIGTGRSGSSWTERMLTLLDSYGPFRLAYLELLIRAADALASKKERDGEYAA